MRYNETLFNLLNKYIDWAKFDWCLLIFKKHTNTMTAYDFEARRGRGITYVIQCMLDNGMLDECFTQDELNDLLNNTPKKFRDEIKSYIKENKNENS